MNGRCRSIKSPNLILNGKINFCYIRPCTCGIPLPPSLVTRWALRGTALLRQQFLGEMIAAHAEYTDRLNRLVTSIQRKVRVYWWGRPENDMQSLWGEPESDLLMYRSLIPPNCFKLLTLAPINNTGLTYH